MQYEKITPVHASSATLTSCGGIQVEVQYKQTRRDLQNRRGNRVQSTIDEKVASW